MGGVMCARGYMQRKSILTTMTFAQGLATLIMCFFVNNRPMMYLLRGINGACLAGLLPVANSTAPDTCGPPEENAAAAGAALVFTSSVPWMVCGALYTSLHYFYPRDMERIFERRRLENEQAEAALNTELVSS